MLGGKHFKKKIDKKVRKKEARKAARSDQDHTHVKRSGNPSSNTTVAAAASKPPSKNKSTLKGPVVAYGDGDFGSRDSANNRHNVPFKDKFEERQYRKKHPLRNQNSAEGDNATKKGNPEGKRAREESGNGVSTGCNHAVNNANSAAQRRRVLKHKTDDDLLDHFREKLNASTFRLLNEQVYNSPTAFASQLLRDSATFHDYHIGYRQQLVQWPMNPNQLILDALLEDRRGKFLANKAKCMPGSIPSSWVVADMGCGEAGIAAALQPKGYTVHSFDFCALNDRVTVADTSQVPLDSNSVDVCVFSLSLMSTDYERSLFEAFRILKANRLLKVVEVRSRIPSSKKFAEMVESVGFTLDYQDVAGDYFVAFDFIKNNQKEANRNVCHPPGEVLLPSLYKKR